ncbi:MAG: hypothetical protein ACRCTQ_01740 [Brevinemataceae bacterium]
MKSNDLLIKSIFTYLFILITLIAALQIPVYSVLSNPVFYEDMRKNFSLKKNNLTLSAPSNITISNFPSHYQISISNQNSHSDILDLFIGFDENLKADNYSIINMNYETNFVNKILGASSGKFISKNSSIVLSPNKNSSLNNQTININNVTIEFYLYPYNMGEGIQTVVSYTSSINKDTQQKFTVTIENGILNYQFYNFFQDKTGQFYNFSLTERKPLETRVWEKHSLILNSLSSSISIYRNDEENCVLEIPRYNSSQQIIWNQENSGVDFPILRIGDNGLFSLDEFSIYKGIKTKNRYLYSQTTNSLESEVFLFSSNISFIEKINVDISHPFNSHYRIAYRTSSNHFLPTTSSKKKPWIFFDPKKNSFPPSASTGRYMQWKIEYYQPEYQKSNSFSINDIVLEYRETPTPSTPVIEYVKPGSECIEIFWSAVPDSNIQSYEIYYGYLPENYFGTANISPNSPISLTVSQENTKLSYKIQGLKNEQNYFISLRSKNIYGAYSGYSQEIKVVTSSINNSLGFSIEE